MRTGITSILSVLFINLFSSESSKVKQRDPQKIKLSPYIKGVASFWLLLTVACLLNPVSVSATTNLDQYTYGANVNNLRTDTTVISQDLGQFASYGEALAAIRNVHPNAQYFVLGDTISYPSNGNSAYNFVIGPELLIRSNWSYKFPYGNLPWLPSEEAAKQNYIQNQLSTYANHTPPLCSIDSITDVYAWKTLTSGVCPYSAQTEAEEKRNQITGVWSYGCASSSTWYAYSCRLRTITCPAQTPDLNRQQQQCTNSGQAQIFETLVACGEGRTLNTETGKCEYPVKNNGGCPITGKNKPSPLAGSPINAFSGNKYQTETDYRDSGFSRLTFRRAHNTQNLTKINLVGGLGQNWISNFHRALRITPSIVQVIRPDGKVFSFANPQTQTGLWLSDPDVFDTIEKLASGWRYRTYNDKEEIYNEQGLLTQISYLNGYSQTLNYNIQNQLDYVEDSFGRRLTFTYDVSDRVETLTAPDSRVWTYRYDVNGNLEFVDNPDGTTRQYVYEDLTFPSFLTGIIDERGTRYATWEYDTQGRGTASYHGATTPMLTDRIDGVIFNYQVSAAVITNSRNVSTTYSFIRQRGVGLVSSITGPSCSSCGAGDSSYEYDPANSNLLAKTIKGVRTEYSNYDTKGNYQTKIIAAGTAEARTINYTYDPRFFGKIASKSKASVCIGSQKVTNYTYDGFGNATSIQVAGFTPACIATSRTTTLQYTGPLNQLSQIDGPRMDVSDITTLDYYLNSASEGNNRARLKTVTSSGIVLRDNLLYTASGKLQSESRPNGVSVTYTYYPGNDRLETVTQSDGVTSRTTRWTYLTTGEVESITLGDGTAQPTTITLGYDAARRLTRITDASGNYIEYSLDTEGNRTGESVYDNAGALQRALTQTYDLYNNLDTTAQVNESGDYNYAADGTLDTLIDGNGTTTDYNYDTLKRLINSTQDLGGTDTTTADALTQYGYDPQDNLTSVTDPINGNTIYSYDDLGNLLSQTSPDTGTTTLTYDEAGNVLTRTDAKGQLFTYAYDALNRLTLLSTSGTGEGTRYIYDTCTNGTGRLCSVTQGTEVTNYSYNAFGDVTQHQGMQYQYDALGRVQIMTYPSGDTITYIYNIAGQIVQIDAIINGVAQTLASNINYAPFGPMTALTYGNGAQLTQTFDQAYRMTDQSTPGIFARNYVLYDANGNLQTVNDLMSNTSDAFNYDSLDRLFDANGAYGTQQFGYDKNGNRVSLTQGTTTTNNNYDPQSNRLNQIGSNVISLDPNGNTLNDGRHSYAFNSYNRLISVDTTLATYQYNGLGQRIGKQTEGASSLDYVALAAAAQTQADSLNQQAATAQQQATGLLAQATQLETDAATAQQQAQQNRTSADALQLQISDLTGQQSAQFQIAADNQASADSYRSQVVTPPNWWQSIMNLIYNLIADYYQFLADAATANADALGQQMASTQAQADALISQATQLEQDAAGLLTQATTLRNQAATLQAQADALTQQATAAQTLADEYTALAQNPPAVTVNYQYVYGLSGQLVGEYDSSNGSPIAEYVYLNGQALAVIKQGNVYTIHTDHLGTPRAVSDTNQTVVWRWDSDPFGATAANDDPDGDGTAFEYNKRFAGQYYDNETGLHYNYFRYYDPSTGRYITSDPIGLQGGFNTYGYVYGDPVNWIDPYGLQGRCSWGPCRGNTPGYSRTTHPFGGPSCGSGWSEHIVPDRGLFGGDYTEACKKHDKCYATCGSKKWECDSDLALGTHNILYLAVILVGGPAYDAAQKESGCDGCSGEE